MVTKSNGETGELRRVQKVPVCLTISCKVVTEDEQGGLLLDVTTQQSVLPDKAPADGGKKLPAQFPVFPIKAKGPGGGLLTEGNFRPPSEQDEANGQHPLQKPPHKLLLRDGPLDVHQHSRSFPFGILRATIDFEVRAQPIRSESGQGVWWPDLCVSNSPTTPDMGIIRVKRSGILLKSNRLAFVRAKPTVEIFAEKRSQYFIDQLLRKFRLEVPRNRHDKAAEPELISYSQMRLTFYLHEPPTNIIYKVVGPLFLVLILMLMNYLAFFEISDVWNGCRGDDERDSDYLANGIGIAITAVFVLPSSHADRTRSTFAHHAPDYDALLTTVFLVGLTLATVPHCRVAFGGCCLSSLVVIATAGCLVYHWIRCSAVRRYEPVQVLDREYLQPESLSQNKTFDISTWTWASSMHKRRPRRGKSAGTPAVSQNDTYSDGNGNDEYQPDQGEELEEKEQDEQVEGKEENEHLEDDGDEVGEDHVDEEEGMEEAQKHDGDKCNDEGAGKVADDAEEGDDEHYGAEEGKDGQEKN